MAPLFRRGSRGRDVAIIGSRGYPSYYGGFETAVRKLAPYLADAGWTVRVYSRAGATRDDDPTRDPRVRQVMTRGIDSTKLSTLSFGLTAVLHCLLRPPAVALVMNVANGYWLPLLKLRGVPTVVNVDGVEWEREKWSRLGKFVFHLGARLTAVFADEIICDARALQDYWEEHFGRRGVFIPYGGAPKAGLPRPSLAGTRPFALIVARFVPENSIDLIFQALPKLSRDLDVVVVGSDNGGPYDEVAEALDREHESITWAGRISDDRVLFGLWEHCALYIHGHSVGGTNPALVQAMMCGAPTVARDTVFNREVLQSSGVFFEPTPESLLEATSTALQLDRDHLSRAVQSRAAEEYTWDLVNAAYAATLASHAR